MKNSLGWLYHLCPDEILGEKLIPLNRQQLLFPSLYQKNSEMYAGREAITRRCIPLLECCWNDVIHLTNIPPREFLNALNEAGKVPNFEQKWLKITAHELDQQVIVHVLGSGNGITPEVEAKLFEPFFTTKAVGEGTGLGLSISKAILNQHQAQFFVNRTFPNTCFEIRFQKNLNTVE